MAIDLVDVVKGYLTPDVIEKAATHVGESSGSTQKALTAVVPALVAALMNKASTTDGAQQLLRMIEVGRYGGSALNGVASMFGGGGPTQSTLSIGQGILDSLFGTRTGDVVSWLARATDVRPESASSLLALAAPLVLHVLGRQRPAVGPGASSLASLLGEQRNFLAGMLPADLDSALGWSGLTSGMSALGTSAAGAVARGAREAATASRAPSRPSWLLPLIILGLLALGLLTWLNWPTSPERDVSRQVSELQLPGGVRISVAEGFEAGAPSLTRGSRATVDSLVAILKAYPTVVVTLEGHTDNTGDPSANHKLSVDRVLVVKRLLVKGGVAEPRIAPYGFGPDRPVASNDTEQGRARNRRLELVVDRR
jgi:outer membrane protein OmpA-like peptidoglycan-associated protein